MDLREKINSVIVSSLYEPLDSLAVSIFTKFTQLGHGMETDRTHLSAISKKSESSLHHYGLELPIIVHIVESFTFFCIHVQERLLLKSKLSRNLARFQQPRLAGRVGFLNEHQEKVHLGAISHGRHDTACFVCCVSRLCWQPRWIIRLNL